MMKKRSKQKQKSVFLFCTAVGVFLTFLTCVDSDSKSQNRNQSLEHQEKQNPQSKIVLSTFSPKSEMKTDNDFALVVLGKLSVGTSKTFYVNGPLADVCVGTLKNEGNFKVTGKLLVGTLQNTGEIKYEDFQEGITCRQVFPPSVTDFIRDQKVIRFGEGWVEEYDRDGTLIRRVEGKFYVDPSGAEWVYRNDGSWGMKGDKPSELEGYSLVFETDFRNPAKRLDVYDGGIYVKGKMKDSGNLVVRDKPDEWSVVVLGDGFFTSNIDITGRVYIGGDMRLVGEDEGEFQGEYRYKIKGDLFVKGDFTSNVNFSINNMKLVQKVADVAVMLEVPGGEALEWVQTTPVGDPKPGEPGVAVVVYRVPPEVSLAPPMSRLTSKTAVAKKDIHKLRSVYRRAERGEMNIVLSAGRILRKSEGGQTNPLEELKEENCYVKKMYAKNCQKI
jgi:hypothetical protein